MSSTASEPAATIRLLLADDQDLVRGGLSALLNLEPDLEVVAEVGPAATSCSQRWKPTHPTSPWLILRCPAWMGSKRCAR